MLNAVQQQRLRSFSWNQGESPTQFKLECEQVEARCSYNGGKYIFQAVHKLIIEKRQ